MTLCCKDLKKTHKEHEKSFSLKVERPKQKMHAVKILQANMFGFFIT